VGGIAAFAGAQYSSSFSSRSTCFKKVVHELGEALGA
jgi:hypothetical protein